MPKRKLFLLIFFILIVSGCITATAPNNQRSSSTIKPAADWYTVYFTDPDNSPTGSFREGPDRFLADAIRKARLRVDVAIYHLNLWSIRDALIAAHNTGVTVRVVVESDNMDQVEIQDLQAAGIDVLGDRRESFMHNKFVVIDQSEVWTGSMNFTINGAYRNNNNLIRIRSVQLAENFTTEFEEMFVHDMFGDNVMVNTPHPVIRLNDTRIETYFSPDDGTEARIVSLVKTAEESVKFMAYSFTSDTIADAMLERAGKGIRVTGVFEEGQYYTNIGTKFDRLLSAGLDVRLDGNSRNMHHKVIIIDDKIVILGSFNFSRNAEDRNDENSLIIYNCDIARLYLEEFARIFSNAK